MIRIVITALALSAIPAAAFEYCDQADKRLEMSRDARGWHEDLKKKRYAELEAVFGAILSDVQDGGAADGKAERALRIFEKTDEWRESRHLDWQHAYPGSAAALLARAHFHVGRALSLRSGRRSQGEEHDAVMRSELAAAREAAGRADRLLRWHSLTDALRIRISAAEDGQAAASRVAREAVATSPRSLAVRMAQIDANGEQWGGKRADMLAFPGQATMLSAEDRRYLEFMVHHHLGESALAAGRRSEAIRSFSRAEPLCPGLEHSAVQLSRLFLEDGKYASAIPMAEHVIRVFPRDGLGYTYRGRAYRGLGRHAEAMKDLQHAVELGRDEAYPELAWYYETGTAVPRDLGKALELYRVGEQWGVANAREGAERVRAALAKGWQ